MLYQGSLQLITDDVFDLLWFIDGPNKNFSEDQQKHVIESESNFFEFNLMVARQEPSGISARCQIMQHDDKPDPLSYFPSYVELTPRQRFSYLQWLQDPTQEVDVGYVFVFYYGLERHLLVGKFEKAFSLIRKLRTHHKNKSFQAYSACSLILSAMFHKRADLLKEVLDEVSPPETTRNRVVFLLGRYFAEQGLRPKEVIAYANSVGFTNKRYLKGHPELFVANVSKVLEKYFGKPEYELDFLDMQSVPRIQAIFTANIAVPPKHRVVNVPDLTADRSFKDSVKGILAEANALTKADLSY